MWLFPVIKNLLFHPDPAKRFQITLIYCGAGIIANFFLLQVFCMPVWWASVLCILFYIAILVFPFIRQQRLRMLLCLLLGIGVPICLYCIIFLANPWNHYKNYIEYIIEIILLGAGLLAFIPFYLLYHIYRYYNVVNKSGRAFFIFGVIIPFIFLGIYLNKFKENYSRYISVCEKIQSSDSLPLLLEKNYFNERLLGIGFKYHTKIEYMNDGWRPPLHDPFLNIGLWVFGQSYYPPPAGLAFRIACYKQLFPDEPVKVDCPCAYTKDGMGYLRDTWWYAH